MVIFVCEAFSWALHFVSGYLSSQAGLKWVPGLEGKTRHEQPLPNIRINPIYLSA